MGCLARITAAIVPTALTALAATTTRGADQVPQTNDTTSNTNTGSSNSNGSNAQSEQPEQPEQPAPPARSHASTVLLRRCFDGWSSHTLRMIQERKEREAERKEAMRVRGEVLGALRKVKTQRLTLKPSHVKNEVLHPLNYELIHTEI